MGYSPPSSSYTPLLLSHQTGLSVATTGSETPYDIGSSISVPRNGIVVISVVGHVSGNTGYMQLSVSRSTGGFYYATGSFSIFGNLGATGFTNTSASPLFVLGGYSSDGLTPYFLLPVLSGDSIIISVSTTVSGSTIYVDDLTVMLI